MHTVIVIACFAAGVPIGLLAMREWRRGSASRAWPRLPCTILRAAIEIDSSGDGAVYKPSISYAYEVDGVAHHGTRIQYGLAYSSRARAERIIRPYTAGAGQVCFVNPADPGDSVLTRGASWGALALAGTAAVFVGIGCALLVFGA